jgi:oligopeptide transport system substrate-binding protein
MKQKATAGSTTKSSCAPPGNFAQKETKTTKVRASGAASPLNESRWDWLSPLFTPFSPSSFPSFVSVKTLFLLLFTATALCADETPRRPNILRLASIFDVQTLDPAKQVMAFDSMVLSWVHLPLLDTTNGPAGPTLVPCAARAWSASPDQRVFTLQLRTDVAFSNGRSVVADDYVYALERILNPDTGSQKQFTFLGIRGSKTFAAHETNHVTGLRAPSADTLVIELERSNPVFPYQLCSLMAVPREEVERLGSGFSVRPVGSGPYMVQEWNRGARLQLTRNPHYHGPEPQHLDGVDLFIGGDETTHLMMFERGELDVANVNTGGIPIPSFRRLSHEPRWQGLIDRAAQFNTSGLIMNTEIPPLDNVFVRRAISHALNRDLQMRVAQGFFTHAEGMLPPAMPGYNPRLRGYDYNPDKARELLRESGLPLPLRTGLWHGTSDANRNQAQGFQWDLKQVGIEVELKEVSGPELVASQSIRGTVPMGLSGYSPYNPDPSELLANNFDGQTITNRSAFNFSFYNNPEVNRLLDLAAPEVELSKRYALYQQAEELIVRDAPWVFLGHRNLFALRQPWLKGPIMGAMSGYRFDRVWIEE